MGLPAMHRVAGAGEPSDTQGLESLLQSLLLLPLALTGTVFPQTLQQEAFEAPEADTSFSSDTRNVEDALRVGRKNADRWPFKQPQSEPMGATVWTGFIALT